MKLYYEGLNVITSVWMPKDRIIKTDSGEIIMHPFLAGCLMLEISNNTYLDVFKSLGVTNDTIDACIEAAIKKVKLK